MFCLMALHCTAYGHLVYKAAELGPSQITFEVLGRPLLENDAW